MDPYDADDQYGLADAGDLVLNEPVRTQPSSVLDDMGLANADIPDVISGWTHLAPSHSAAEISDLDAELSVPSGGYRTDGRIQRVDEDGEHPALRSKPPEPCIPAPSGVVPEVADEELKRHRASATVGGPDEATVLKLLRWIHNTRTGYTGGDDEDEGVDEDYVDDDDEEDEDEAEAGRRGDGRAHAQETGPQASSRAQAADTTHRLHSLRVNRSVHDETLRAGAGEDEQAGSGTHPQDGIEDDTYDAVEDEAVGYGAFDEEGIAYDDDVAGSPSSSGAL